MLLDEIKNIKSGKKHLREFGFTVGTVFGLIGLFLLWKGREHYVSFIAISILLILTGLLLPTALKPIQKIWMAIALVIGFIMTRVILFFLFYFILTPIAILARLSGKESLSLKLDKKAQTYWISRKQEKRTKVSYEKQF